MFFVQDYRERIKKEHPDAGFGEVGKLLGEKWKAMSSSEKKVSRAVASCCDRGRCHFYRGKRHSSRGGKDGRSCSARLRPESPRPQCSSVRPLALVAPDTPEAVPHAQNMADPYSRTRTRRRRTRPARPRTRRATPPRPRRRRPRRPRCVSPSRAFPTRPPRGLSYPSSCGPSHLQRSPTGLYQ